MVFNINNLEFNKNFQLKLKDLSEVMEDFIENKGVNNNEKLVKIKKVLKKRKRTLNCDELLEEIKTNFKSNFDKNDNNFINIRIDYNSFENSLFLVIDFDN
jgi:hypothetical protein